MPVASQNVIGRFSANPINIGQTDFNALFVGNINTSNTSHCISTFLLNLSNGISPQPWRCLCLGFSQITITRPFLLMILHFSQIFFTEGFTFIFFTVPFCTPQWGCLVVCLFRSVSDASFVQVIHRHLDGHLVAQQNFDIIHADFAGNGGSDDMIIGKLNFESGVGGAPQQPCPQIRLRRLLPYCFSPFDTVHGFTIHSTFVSR